MHRRLPAPLLVRQVVRHPAGEERSHGDGHDECPLHRHTIRAGVMSRLTDAQRRRFFGEHCTASERVTTVTPWGIKVQVHRQILDVYIAACTAAYARVPWWRPQRIDGFNCRQIRGSTAWSLHAYALAHDYFITAPGVPPPGGVWTPDNGVPPEFAECFTELGFTWGATFNRKDVPHIEWAAAPPDPARPPWRGSGSTTTAPVRHPSHRNVLGGKPVATYILDIPLDGGGIGAAPICPEAKFISCTPYAEHGKYAGDNDTIIWPVAARLYDGTYYACAKDGAPNGVAHAVVTVAD